MTRGMQISKGYKWLLSTRKDHSVDLKSLMPRAIEILLEPAFELYMWTGFA